MGAPGPKASIDRVDTFRKKNTAMWHVASVENILRAKPQSRDADILIIGDSRARAMTGPWRDDSTIYVTDYKNRKIFNLAYGGAELTTSIKIYDYYKARFPDVDTIIFSINFDTLAKEKNRLDQIEEALNASRNPLYYYLNFRTLMFSLKSLSEIKDPPIQQVVSNELTEVSLSQPISYRKKVKYHQSNKPKRHFNSKRRIKRNKRFQKAVVSAEQTTVIASIRDKVIPLVQRNPDKKFIFLAMPLHPTLERQIKKNQSESYSIMSDMLSELGVFYDASMYDGAATVFHFFDSVHVKQAAPDIMQDALDCLEKTANYHSVIAYDGFTPCSHIE
jgi:hypothetical protein